MRDLARALRISGKPVPLPWRTLSNYIKPRTGSVMVVLAQSGVGKSALGMNWALGYSEPSLYISLDTELADHAIRVIARDKHLTTTEIEKGHDEDEEAWAEQWRPVLEELDYPVRFCDRWVSAEQIGELIEAETEWLGETPRLVIVDNLMNLIRDESAGEYRRVLGELVRVAKKYHALIVALHHLRKKPAKKDEDDEDDRAKPVRLSDSLYAIDQEPKYVLGLWAPNDYSLSVGVLKNRMGPLNPDGVTLYTDMAHMRIWDPRDKQEAA
jgi:hypothetical protein